MHDTGIACVRYSVDMKIALFTLLAILLVSSGSFFFKTERSVPSPQVVESQKNDPSSVPLTSLNRSGQGLTKLPSGILTMTHLEQLDISNNRLSGALPAEIRFLQKLQILDLSDNAMTGLPAELGQLSQLRVLDASNNKLTGIPHELGNLQNLEVLDLSDNSISEQDLDVIRAKLPKTTEIIL